MSGTQVAGWDVDVVCTWLGTVEAVGSDTIASFRENEIDGQELLELSNEDLRDDLGVKVLKARKAIMRAVAALQAPAPKGAGGSAEEGAPAGHGEAMRSRVLSVETPSVLSPITGWEDKPLVPLLESTAKVPVKGVQVHAKVAMEFGEDYKAAHPEDPRSPDQLGAVHLYTQGWAICTESLYAVLNGTLSKEDRSGLVIWFFYIKLLVTALMVERPYIGTLWRGINKCLASDYPVGKRFRWWRFTRHAHKPLYISACL
jgi:hypothetical protein